MLHNLLQKKRISGPWSVLTHRGRAMKVRVRLSDGTYPFLDPINDAQLALTAKRKREKTLEAKAAGIDVVEDPPVTGKQTPLTEASAEYLAEVKAARAPKTFLAYSRSPSSLP
jgi:hypothetical protein